MSNNVEIIARNLRFPQGPVALPDGGVAFVEIGAGRVSRLDGNEVSTIAVTGGGPNGLAVGPDGALYVCNNGGFEWEETPERLRPLRPAKDYTGGRIERIDLATGQVTVLYTECNGVRLSAPNDIVFDRQGGFYFSDFGKSFELSQDHGSVYYAQPDGSRIDLVIRPMAAPNGVGLSPDETVLYVTETERARLWAFDIVRPGVIARQPFPSPHGGRFLAGPGGHIRFDSLAIQANGHICVGTLLEGVISVFDPDGKPVRKVKFPDIHTSNIAFGGKDLRTAYVTQSYSGTLCRADWDEPGLRLNFSNL